ncbi:MAG: C25 family cysteine peptidase [Ignavibacteria bacterium]
MKKIFLLFAICLLGNVSLIAQNYGWISPNTSYLKMYVADDGIYRINKTDFTNAGITSTIDPRTVKVYNKGVEIPVFFNGETDGIFDASDYLDFYGTRNSGGLTKVYDQNNSQIYSTNEYFNQYSDTNIYWIGWGGSFGSRYTVSTFSTITNYPNAFYNDIVHLERDYFYSQGENTSSTDYRFLTTEKFKGEGWFWSSLASTQTLSDTFSLPLLYNAVSQNASVKLYAYPTKRNTATLNEHSLQVKVNGNLITTLVVNDLTRFDTTIIFPSSFLSNSSVNTVSVTYNYIIDPATNIASYLNVDFFEIQYPKVFKFRSEKVSSALTGIDTTSKQFRVTGYNSVNPVFIYDVFNNIKIVSVSNNLDTLKFTGKSNGKFLLVNNQVTKKPFRIKQKLVPDLVSSSNGADYLIIYNSLFTSQAEQLRSYRASHDNFRSFKANVEDLYDIFNYGIEDPVAVRNFTKHVYDNWQLPKLSYICLFGRGSLDPKKILSTSAYYQNLIPVFGYPPSDGYFANFNIGTFFYYSMVAIGRLPVYYPSEAQAVVDKIIAYENETPAVWSKSFLYITGGGTSAEQSSHQQKSNLEINTYIIPPSLEGDPIKAYRSDTSGSVTFNIKDSIRNSISRGVFFVNYRGHAGSHDWEIAMNDPNTLENGNRLPMVLSLTCFTGENSLGNYRGFGERFIYLNNKGSIGYVGTTGWSYSAQGNDYGTHIIYTLKNDTTRRLGGLTKYANKKMSTDSLSFNVRHTVNCYTLLGDPAVTLKLPVRPEFSVSASDYKLSNIAPSLGDNVTLSLYPKNFGTNADSCKIRFQLKRNNINYSVIDTIRRNLGTFDSLNYNFKVDSIGNYSVVVTLDYGNYYPLENKLNNTLTIDVPVNNTSFVPLKPYDNSIVSNDSVEFVGLNPSLSSSTNKIKVIVQFDTTKLFNSSFVRTFVNGNATGTVTKFKAALPVLTNNKLYFWRTNCINNGDSSGWSKAHDFVYSTSGTSSSKDDISGAESNTAKGITIIKNNSAQYSAGDFNNTEYSADGIDLVDFQADLFVRSLGSNAEESSYFSVGGKNIYIDAGSNTGLNFLKIQKLTGNIVSFKNIKMNSSASSDSIVTYLNTFDNTHYLMLLNAAYVPSGTFLNAAAKTKLKQFGSIYCDSIGLLGYFHTWSLVGFLGATPPQVSEMFDPCCRPAPFCVSCDHWGESISNLTTAFRKTTGTVSTIIGPAQNWSSFSWNRSIPQGSSLMFDVFGIDRNNAETLLLSNLLTYQSSSLSSVNAYQYPKLKFVAKFNIDTVTGNQSPVLNSINVNYTPPSELSYDANSFSVNSSYKVGEVLKYKFDYHNDGSSDLPGIIANVYKKSLSVNNLISTDTTAIALNVDSYKNYSNKFVIPYFRDSMKIYIELKPKGLNNESYAYNNLIEFSMNSVHLNGQSPLVSVYSDGLLLTNGDYVKPKPELKINLTNVGEASLVADTTMISLSLNEKYIPYYVNGILNQQLKTFDKDDSKPGKDLSLYFYPELLSGTNKLAVVYNSGSDNTDTVFYDVIVSDELLVKDLSNFPNPMKDMTNFVFNLAGSDSPLKFKIKIYTVSGKLIKELDYPVSIGHNQIPWDGRDGDGDLVANGTYLYKLVAEGDSKTETQIQKLVVLK